MLFIKETNVAKSSSEISSQIPAISIVQILKRSKFRNPYNRTDVTFVLNSHNFTVLLITGFHLVRQRQQNSYTPMIFFVSYFLHVTSCHCNLLGIS